MIAYWLNGFTICHLSSQLPSPWERAGVRLGGSVFYLMITSIAPSSVLSMPSGPTACISVM